MIQTRPSSLTVQVKIPEAKIFWLRGSENITFKSPFTFLVLGMRGSGKSSLLEVIATFFPKIIDLYGSSDNEGLCWCRPEFTEVFKKLHGREPKILLITGDRKEVASKFDSVPVSKVTLSDFTNYDVIVAVDILYSDEEDYFAALQHITFTLWKQRTHWTEPWFVLIREAANWIYSRQKIAKDDKLAKAEFIKSLREARHHGLAVGVDTLRWTSLDKELRDVSDYVFLKRAGAIGYPDDLRFMYRYIDAYSAMKALPEAFMILTGRGNIGFGYFDFPNWHKQERDNILALTEIETKTIEQALPDERRYGVGDFEHSEIIIKYMEQKSMRKVASTLGRSLSSIHAHITRHNTAVERKGECLKCHHSNCQFSKDFIIKKK